MTKRPQFLPPSPFKNACSVAGNWAFLITGLVCAAFGVVVVQAIW